MAGGSGWQVRCGTVLSRNPDGAEISTVIIQRAEKRTRELLRYTDEYEPLQRSHTYLHRANLVHRTLTPVNALETANPTRQITNSGLPYVDSSPPAFPQNNAMTPVT